MERMSNVGQRLGSGRYGGANPTMTSHVVIFSNEPPHPCRILWPEVACLQSVAFAESEHARCRVASVTCAMRQLYFQWREVWHLEAQAPDSQPEWQCSAGSRSMGDT